MCFSRPPDGSLKVLKLNAIIFNRLPFTVSNLTWRTH